MHDLIAAIFFSKFSASCHSYWTVTLEGNDQRWTKQTWLLERTRQLELQKEDHRGKTKHLPLFIVFGKNGRDEQPFSTWLVFLDGICVQGGNNLENQALGHKLTVEV